nr:hypothetical protein [Tanacetum cinerariifolium]
MPTAGVVIRDTPGDGVGSQPKNPDKQQDKTTGTNEGTGTIPGVPDVPKYQSESENESYRNSEDDDRNDDDDDVDSDVDEEYIYTPKNYEFSGDDEEYEELYKDVNVRLKDVKHEEEGKGDAEMTNIGHEDGTQQTTYEHVKDDEDLILTIVHHDEPSTQTPSLLTIPVIVIPKTSTAAAPIIPPTILPITPLPQQSTSTPTLTTETTTTSINSLPDFSSLFRFDQRVPASYTTEFKKKAQAKKKRYTDLVENSMKDINKDEVKRAQEHKDLYDGLVKSYKLNKDLFESYGKAYSLKIDRKNKDKDEDPPAGSDQGLKRRKTSKDVEPSKGSKSKESKSGSSKGTKSQPKSSGKSVQAEESVFKTEDIEMPQNQESYLGNIDDQPNAKAASECDWFKKSERPSTPNSDWNATKSIDFRPPQTWISRIAQTEKPPLTFDELMSTPIDFSAYVMNNLKIDNLTQEHLVGLAFNLLKWTCKNQVELEYHFKECYKAVTNRLDWNNPEGQEYLFDLSKPQPLIEDRGRQVVPVNYFINNDLEYLKGGSSRRKYMNSTRKTKVAKYDDIQGIEDMVPSL